MRRFLRDNGLSLVLLGLFALCLVGHGLTGHREYNQERLDHREAPVPLGAYLRSGHFLESVFENWESEFLQMGFYVILTVFLFQKGSSESKDPDGPADVDEDPRLHRSDPDAPAPVRRGGLVLALYTHSLSIAFLALFTLSFALHAVSGAALYNAEQAAHGEAAISLGAFVATSTFWFESFQNWQSEFLAVAAIVVLSVFLRERGSPESKPVAMPHGETPGG